MPITDDVQATGDRMDAIGMLGNRLIAIETKVTVARSTVEFDPARSGTIEPKIAGTLAPLYAGSTLGQVGSIAQHWDRSAPLTVAVLARHFTETGLPTLTAMLHARATEWHFRYRIWKWSTDRIVELAIGGPQEPRSREQLAALQFPKMIAKPFRRRPPSLDQFTVLADRCGVAAPFTAIIERAQMHDMVVQRRSTSLALLRQRPDDAMVFHFSRIFGSPSRHQLRHGCCTIS